MIITPSQIEHSGPGVDLSSLPEGVSIKMSDPVKNFAYARNAVTLTFDLSGYENVHLAFEAMEFGEEPHAPPPNPFTGEADFDGVAVSAEVVEELRRNHPSRSKQGFTVFFTGLPSSGKSTLQMFCW